MKRYPEDGACVGEPVSFFVPDPEKDDYPLNVLIAQSICETCPFRANCLAEAKSNPNTVGVWGGELFELPEETAEEK